jgi:hypothetical protein
MIDYHVYISAGPVDLARRLEYMYHYLLITNDKGSQDRIIKRFFGKEDWRKSGCILDLAESMSNDTTILYDDQPFTSNLALWARQILRKVEASSIFHHTM